MSQLIHLYTRRRMSTFMKRIKGTVLFGLISIALLVFAGIISAQENQDMESLKDPDTPKYEHLFNCLCEMEVVDGEIDDSQNCGKPLANCSCGFSKQMRNQLRLYDEQGLGRRKQIEAFKEEYSQFDNKVLAVPDPDSNNWMLAYLVPPIAVVLALLFVGGIGWYWLEDRLRTDTDSKFDDDPVDELNEEIEQEIEEYRQS